MIDEIIYRDEFYVYKKIINIYRISCIIINIIDIIKIIVLVFLLSVCGV